jgi:hypothetical protein
LAPVGGAALDAAELLALVEAEVAEALADPDLEE